MNSRIEEHDRLVALCGRSRRDLNKYEKFLERETVFDRLHREAFADENTFIWYADRDCVTKGYQWLQASRAKYMRLIALMLGTLSGLSVEEIEKQIDEAVKTIPEEDYFYGGHQDKIEEET
jgi:hypothetical protein